ncbi:MAG: nucleoside deaminase [Bacteroidales bacterium]|nr:nucleoside deaminase [Bacteroidales bacterium]MEE1098206.1 nucleoside deaminase [Bacteroidales bacterium]
MNVGSMGVLEYDDEYFMRIALEEARYAFDEGEVPVGGVIVCGDKVIARGHNLVMRLNDPTAHVEMQLITCATDYIGSRYLQDCTLYVTLEPCVMCAGAMYWSQIGRVVFGADDPKRGAARMNQRIYHPKTVVDGGVMRDECAEVLKSFFNEKR